jgi:hypothetical protein
MSVHSPTQFPSQKKSFSQKSKKWAKECIEAAEDYAIFRNEGIRQSYSNKLTNYNLANDVLDTKDMEKVANPLGIKDATFPAKMQNYPIAVPKIDLLVGEERKRRFDWQVRVINDDAISAKENNKKEEIKAFLVQQIQAEAISEEDLQQKLQAMDKYMTYEWQDLRERTASQILRYLYQVLNLKDVFSRGFEDALIAGEEIYCAEIVGGEPVLRRVNPLNIHTVRTGESPYIEDADIIIEDGYYSPGQIIDRYYDYLKPTEVNQIDKGNFDEQEGDFISIGEREKSLVLDNIIEINGGKSSVFGQYFDEEGNIRVIRVCWRSMKKVYIRTYVDQFGMPQQDIKSEFYKAKPGEELEIKWIGEWWEGTRIANSIYVKIEPRPIQFRSMTNIAKCGSGYVGTAYNINNSKAKSLMDRMKPYQYMYNVFMYRTELAFAKAKGRIGKLDLSRIPEGWEVDKWMYYAEIMGWAVEDPFRESNKGVSQGKLAGHMNQSQAVLDLELGNYIQQHIMMLQFIETQMGEISGVSKQRQGQIENRELVGNVERSVTQSSHITEKWFSIHDNTRKRALSVLLETAKYAWKDQKDKRVQYVLDDMSTSMLNINGPIFNEADYSLTISDSSSDRELLETIKQLAQAGLQNDKINFSQIIDIYSNPSIADMRRKLEKYELDAQQRMQEQQQQAAQMQEQMIQAQAQEKQAERQHDFDKLNLEFQHDVALKEMDLEAKTTEKLVDADLDNDGIPDLLEMEKVRSQERIKEKELQSKEKIEKDKLKHDASEGEKERRSKEKIASMKPKPTTAKK